MVELASPQRQRGPAALRRPGFRQLTVAWVFTNAADSALWLVLAVWVKDLTGSDGAAASVFVALGLPTLLAPFIGHLADRVSRKALLAAGNGLMVPAVLALLLVGDAGDVWLVYVVTFLYGAMGYVTASAQSGLVRDLLDDDELAGGNGLLSTVDQAFRLVSPLLGTALYVVAGPLAVIALTGTCFAITAALLTRVEVVETPPEPTTDTRFWSELAGGLRHLLATAPLGALTVALAVATGATGLVNVAVFPLMEQGLGVDPALLGIFVSLQGVGAVVGGLTAARVLGRVGEARAVAGGLATMALGMAPLLLVGGLDAPAVVTLTVAAAGLAVLGLGVPWAIVAFITLRQRMTPARLQGRVSAATNIALNLPQTLVTLGAAAVVGAVDYRVLVAVTVAGVLAASALALRAARPTP
ncbi:MFS transporter [Georgenia satyanarayanai]|uniref:MFS transporter n=1 Tax=Georgenia satyanarayanai TaxID=860221 RepID=UPI0012653337|nr:MFS transporter [Georgenia satyanarayanai]